MAVVALPKLHTEAEAAAALGFSTDTLQRARRAGRIRYRRLGNGRGRIRYTDADLNEYLKSCEESPSCQSETSGRDDMGHTGSPADRTAQCGAEPGTTAESVRRAANRLAQMSSTKQTVASLRGSWRTEKPETNVPQTFPSS
jgi:excisionase family DNA binding protein